MVTDLTGLDIANSSLLDEATAAAEAMTMMRRATRAGADRLLVDDDVLPQTLAVLTTRATPLDLQIETFDADSGLPDSDAFGVVLAYPGAGGRVRDPQPLIEAAHHRGLLVCLTTDLLALTLLRSPGELGADIAVGSSQRFGVPIGFGGPHAGFLAARHALSRSLPGRLVGVSVDDTGYPAYRLALQTREQHIRREKATSNICTAQVLLAVVAAMYAVYHGPAGLAAIATDLHDKATTLATALADGGFEVVHDTFFDTVLVRHPDAGAVIAEAEQAGVYLRAAGADLIAISIGETVTAAHLGTVLACFGLGADEPVTLRAAPPYSARLARSRDYLTHEVFNSHHSETAMLRYLRRLADKDYALDRGMIPLGSCTMKLNAAAEMEPISYPGFAEMHPFGPPAPGYATLIADLEGYLAAVTGYAKVSIQPNAGSQGEYAGLLAIRRYHVSRGDSQRDVCLIPASAHGTNAASAVMAGMRVVVVKTAADGTVDLDDLQAHLQRHGERVGALMVTYPSTHGVYEEGIGRVCDLVHEAGGQVYVDGANLNALLGFAEPGRFGGDVSHLNLHKTFCIPHGGGGPGVGPVAVAEHLVPFLPGHPAHPRPEARDCPPVSAAPFGSASILPISWAYIRMMGAPGLARATAVAVLSANYVARRLTDAFPVLYTGNDGLVAHECILDLRPLTKATGVSAEDVAKRLMDYGFHAPTMSFPVSGTLMVEPTESEDLAELDRFIEAMLAIRAEIDEIASGEVDLAESALRRAPHTARCLLEEWNRPYSREQAVFPGGVGDVKYWPPVGRIDQPYGDRHLVCSCPPPEAFAQ
jgi:glycine dehydrogenase